MPKIPRPAAGLTIEDTTTRTVECDYCGDKLAMVPAGGPTNGFPPGYHITLTRFTEMLSARQGDAFFCSKDCLLEGLKFGASHIYNRGN